MKVFNRSLSGFLAVLMTLSVFATTPIVAYAEDDTPTAGTESGLDQEDTTNGSVGGTKGDWAWRIFNEDGGYKVTLIFSRNGAIDTSKSAFSGEFAPTTSILSLNPDMSGDYKSIESAYCSNATPYMTQIRTPYRGFEQGDFMGNFDLATNDLSVNGAARDSLIKKITDLPLDNGGVFTRQTLIYDSTGAVYQAIGAAPAAGGARDALATQFAATGWGSLIKEILSLCTAGGETTGLTAQARACRQMFMYISNDLQGKLLKLAGIKGKPSTNSSDWEKLVPYMLPDSPDCVVGWAAIVEPVYRLRHLDEEEIYVDECYENFFGTALEWASVWGATSDLACWANDTYSDPSTSPLQLTQLEESLGTWIGKNGPKKWGIFTEAYAALDTTMPGAVVNTNGWFGSNAGALNTPETPASISMGGLGVGIYKNSEKAIPEAPPCCYPANPTDDPCPCGGPVPCNCPPGCTCDPNNYTEGCDCVDPPPKLKDTRNPIIHEDHLTQKLEKDVTLTNPPKTFTVAYKDEYPGSSRHNGDRSEYFEVTIDGTQETVTTYSCGTSTTDSTHMAQHWAMGIKCTQTGSSVTGDPPRKEEWYHNWHVYENYKYVWEAGQEFTGSIPSANLTTYSKMTSDSEALELLKKGDRAQIKWDGHIDDTFTETDPNQTTSRGNLYEGSNHVTWISHRFAVNSTARNAVWLSKYMTNYESTEANKKYKTSMENTGFGGTLETTNGAKITESLNSTEGTFNLDFHVGNNEPLKWPYVSEKATYKFDSTGTYEEPREDTKDNPASCGMGSPQSVDTSIVRDALTTVTLNQANFSIDIAVQGTYAGSSKKQTFYNQDPKVTVSGNGNTWTFTTPSSLFAFYPSYKMKAIYDVNGSDQDVWCLSRRMRYFRGEDKLVITVNSAGGNIESSWSRDYGDPEYTTKAGNAYQYTGKGGTVTFDGYFHILDPDFAPNRDEQAQRNNEIVASYVDQLRAVMKGISDDSVGIYSNLPYAAYNSIYAPKLSGYVGKNEGREGMILKSASASGALGGTTYAFLPGFNDAQTSRRSNGASVSSDGVNNGFLTRNLERGGGILVSGWYNEDFEGIIQVHVTATVNVGDVKPEMAIVDEHLSDFKTDINALAQPITVDTGVGAFTKARGKFAIGVECNIGPVSWGGASANVVAMFDPVTFNVRGSSYDQAD